MIVNGQSEFNGSNKSLSDQAIKKALEHPAKHRVGLSANLSAGSSPISLNYQISEVGLDSAEDEQDYVLNVAIVSKAESIQVANGENSGRTLTHASVVKSFKVVPLLSFTGTLALDSSKVDRSNAHIIAYVQSKKTWEVTGAASIEF